MWTYNRMGAIMMLADLWDYKITVYPETSHGSLAPLPNSKKCFLRLNCFLCQFYFFQDKDIRKTEVSAAL